MTGIKNKTPVCSLCCNANEPVYVGSLRCVCKMKIAICRECKPGVLEQFKTIRQAATALAKLHIIQCKNHRRVEEKKRNEIFVDISDKYTPCDCPREMN